MTGKASRDKGGRGEREAAEHMRSVFPSAQRGEPQTRGARRPDVIGTPFWIEVKRRKGYIGIRSALKQGQQDCQDGRLVAAVVRQDRDKWIICFDLEDFLEDILAGAGGRTSSIRACLDRYQHRPEYESGTRHTFSGGDSLDRKGH